jgi:hypothetical protein
MHPILGLPATSDIDGRIAFNPQAICALDICQAGREVGCAHSCQHLPCDHSEETARMFSCSNRFAQRHAASVLTSKFS